MRIGLAHTWRRLHLLDGLRSSSQRRRHRALSRLCREVRSTSLLYFPVAMDGLDALRLISEEVFNSTPHAPCYPLATAYLANGLSGVGVHEILQSQLSPFPSKDIAHMSAANTLLTLAEAAARARRCSDVREILRFGDILEEGRAQELEQQLGRDCSLDEIQTCISTRNFANTRAFHPFVPEASGGLDLWLTKGNQAEKTWLCFVIAKDESEAASLVSKTLAVADVKVEKIYETNVDRACLSLPTLGRRSERVGSRIVHDLTGISSLSTHFLMFQGIRKMDRRFPLPYTRRRFSAYPWMPLIYARAIQSGLLHIE